MLMASEVSPAVKVTTLPAPLRKVPFMMSMGIFSALNPPLLLSAKSLVMAAMGVAAKKSATVRVKLAGSWRRMSLPIARLAQP